jgi:hypothetical protein
VICRLVPFALAAILAACAAKQPQVTLEPPVALRSQFDRIELAVLEAPPPAVGANVIEGRGSGALHGAATGAGAGLGISADMVQGSGGEPIVLAMAILASLVVIPVFALGGAVVGGVSAHSGEEVETARVTIESAVEALDFGELMRARLAATELPQPGPRLVEVPPEGGSEEPAAAARLEITLSEIGFRAASGGKQNDPDLWFHAVAQARLRATENGDCLFGGRWAYQGQKQAYFALAANDAALLRQEFTVAAQSLADAISQDLFISSYPSDAAAPAPRVAVAVPDDVFHGCAATLVYYGDSQPAVLNPAATPASSGQEVSPGEVGSQAVGVP